MLKKQMTCSTWLGLIRLKDFRCSGVFVLFFGAAIHSITSIEQYKSGFWLAFANHTYDSWMATGKIRFGFYNVLYLLLVAKFYCKFWASGHHCECVLWVIEIVFVCFITPETPEYCVIVSNWNVS